MCEYFTEKEVDRLIEPDFNSTDFGWRLLQHNPRKWTESPHYLPPGTPLGDSLVRAGKFRRVAKSLITSGDKR
jgi:hypothetical protein